MSLQQVSEKNGTSESGGTSNGDTTFPIRYRKYVPRRQSNKDADSGTLTHTVPVPMRNARNANPKLTLEGSGFELVPFRDGMAEGDFWNDQLIKDSYYPAVSEMIKKLTGAAEVKPFHHLVRAKGVEVYAGIAHSDYAPKAAEDLAKLSSMRPFRGRMKVINVWKSIDDSGSIKNHHLAMCDATTSVAPDDFIPFSNFEPGKATVDTFHMNGNYHSFHKWFYYPEMTRSEALVFKQWDSDPRSPTRFTFHSAISFPGVEEYNRKSIETRLVAFFPDEPNSMPDFSVPPKMRVDTAKAKVKEALGYLKHWDGKGQEWALGLVARKKFADLCRGYIHHAGKVEKQPEFTDLSPAQTEEVIKCVCGDKTFQGFLKKLADEIED
uniref:Uncharacterized protein n=1 Tax=Chromera velia CCMP2878 TaxID=1169474 RepID=A0A0G4HP34_9ALVE|eukprot:Cvel_7731.t1-p1 / transcript=Cvel_7731.t1 / gene=Cvel_7731 / organism=Chromera_velia_CCMP2878 / gene_product=hypothetical protein / transcript_product=hypothetical protein / location=Cvel_scaffold411:27681-30019(+) / protein_length=379 / sequence_SO=supercontig / SO=protein_coding / is_pseudo=false